MILTALQIIGFAHGAGFPATECVTMAALALRESAGDPAAHNGNAATGDDSYGLWQINLRSPEIAALVKSMGLAPADLLDPANNARVAFAMYGGKLSNLHLAWYYDRPGPYQAKYEAHLPAAQNAALVYFALQRTKVVT